MSLEDFWDFHRRNGLRSTSIEDIKEEYMLFQKQRKLERELEFRMYCDDDDRYLSPNDINWFCDQIRKKIKEKYIKENEEWFLYLVKKYIIDHPDGKWDIRFDYGDRCQLSFFHVVESNWFYDIKDTTEMPKKTSRKQKIEIEEDDLALIAKLIEKKNELKEKLSSIDSLNEELMELLSMEELFKVFPDAKKMFEERDSQIDDKKFRHKKYEFVADLLCD